MRLPTSTAAPAFLALALAACAGAGTHGAMIPPPSLAIRNVSMVDVEAGVTIVEHPRWLAALRAAPRNPAVVLGMAEARVGR